MKILPRLLSLLAAFTLVAACSLLPAPNAAQPQSKALQVVDEPGWVIYKAGRYRYGPSIVINADNSIDLWTCSPGTGEFAWDYIRYQHSADGGKSWDPDGEVVLTPTAGSRDSYAACDPGVIRFGGYTYLGYTSTVDKRATDNEVFVARQAAPAEGSAGAGKDDGADWEKWNGGGWGGETVAQFIDFTGDPLAYGAGEPAFVLITPTLYIYYSWVDAGLNQTRVATADARDPDWPAHLTDIGVAIERGPGEDSTDIKYVDAYQKFIGVSTRQRFGGTSSLQFYESRDGLKFTPIYTANYYDKHGLHNAGLSGDWQGHLDLQKANFVAYALQDIDYAWTNWDTYLNPIRLYNGELQTPESQATELFDAQAVTDTIRMTSEQDIAAERFQAERSLGALEVYVTCSGLSASVFQFELYRWQDNYASTLSSTPLITETFHNFSGQAWLRMDFPALPAGEYLWALHNPRGKAGMGLFRTEAGETRASAYWNGAEVAGDYLSRAYYYPQGSRPTETP